MSTYDYKIAKGIVSDVEKDRMFCVALNTVNGVVNWEKATADYGSASVDSMKVSVRNVFKKIEKAGGKLDADGAVAPATPATTGKSASKKRKTADKSATAAEADDEDEPETPAPKKGRGRAKKTKAADKTKIKGEDGEEAEGGYRE